MTPSQEVAKRNGGDVAKVGNLTEDALIAAAKGEQNVNELLIPILKVGQPLTKEVTEGDASAGDFINGLTGQTFGDHIAFIICQSNTKGRFARTEEGRVFVAGSEPNIPESWEDLVGDSYVGTPFAEYPDAEEQYRRRVNEGEIEWGRGPLVSTTVNFTGIVVSDEQDDDDTPQIPVRLSLMRSQVKSARKINTMVQFLRAPWDNVFDLSTEKRNAPGSGVFYVVNARQGRKTTADERQEALRLAHMLIQGSVTFAGEEALADARSEAGSDAAPDAAGGLAV